jgi:hypothetical protein
LSIGLLPADPVRSATQLSVHIEAAHIAAAKHRRAPSAACLDKKSSFMGTCGTASA